MTAEWIGLALPVMFVAVLVYLHLCVPPDNEDEMKGPPDAPDAC